MHFKRSQRKCSCIGGQILPTRKYKIQNLSVWNKPLIYTCQYCSTCRANQALRLLANVGFQSRGICQTFPSFLSPSPLFHIWLSFHFSRGQNRKFRSSVFPCSETKRKRLLRKLDDSLKLRFPWRRFIYGTDWDSRLVSRFSWKEYKHCVWKARNLSILGFFWLYGLSVRMASHVY